MFKVPLWLVPRGSREGDVLSIKINLDREATEKRKKEVAGLAQRLFKD